MTSERVKVNYGTEEALLAVVDRTKSHKIFSWREQCGSLTEELFLQCPRLHEAKELVHLFDFEPYRVDQAEQAQGVGEGTGQTLTAQTQSVQSPGPVPYGHTVYPPFSGEGPAGPISGSAPSPAGPSADYRLRDDSSVPSREPPRRDYPSSRDFPPNNHGPSSREPPRRDYYYPPSRESPSSNCGPLSREPPRRDYVYPPSGESRPDIQYPPRESSPVGQGEYRSQGRRDWPPRLPRSLNYDGRTSWHSFLRKFTSYAVSCQWSPSECLDALGWCLEGSASDCFSNLRDMGTNSYYPMLLAMGRRFGATRFPEEAIAEFRTARQLPEESLLGWSDRLQALSFEAFGWDQRGDSTQMVLQLCQGCTDKAAGLTALNTRPKSVEEALEAIRWAQHTQRVVYGSEARRTYSASRQQVQQTCMYDQEVDRYDTVIYHHRQPHPLNRSPTVSKGQDVPRPAPVEDRGKVTTPFEVQARNDIGYLKEEVASLKTHAYNTDCMLEEILKTVKSLEFSMLSNARPLSPVATGVPENLEGSESEADLRSGNREAYNR
ncbi:uncharacterized protein LOC105438153 [Strongylocentrotus purpuratus]|uniref:Uncharacterized protein n=1 Tax=Strongylocentrotus purpuratus TaxID=7668 RepID=A0A7M7NHI0_STRPU|nr:uncharacterized protein LOC105438153 [Strongylocentrotus purpuratus]